MDSEITAEQLSNSLAGYLKAYPEQKQFEEYVRFDIGNKTFGIMSSVAGTKEDKRIMLKLDNEQVFWITIEEHLA